MADEATSHVIEDINSTSRPKRSRDDQEEPDVSAGASKLPKFAEQDGIKVNPNSKASSKEPQCAQIFLPFLAKYVAKYEASKGPEGTPEQDPMALIDERFEVFHAGARGIVIVGVKGIVPSQFMEYFFNTVKADKSYPQKCFLERLIPCDTFCEGSYREITKAAQALIDEQFPSDPSTFGIIARERNSPNGVEKQKLIDTIAKLVPPIHKVDLKFPSLNIVVEVFKSAAGLSIVSNFNALHKFNMGIYCTGINPNPPKPAKTDVPPLPAKAD